MGTRGMKLTVGQMIEHLSRYPKDQRILVEEGEGFVDAVILNKEETVTEVEDTAHHRYINAGNFTLSCRDGVAGEPFKAIIIRHWC